MVVRSTMNNKAAGTLTQRRCCRGSGSEYGPTRLNTGATMVVSIPSRSLGPLAAILAACAALALAPPAHADGTGWYTPSQVSQGRWEYAQKCAVCHGAQLQGAGGPALKGKIFVERGEGKKLSDLYEFVHGDMPLGLGASLPSQEYADIVAFLLAQSGLPAGTEMYTPKSPMDRVLELSAAQAGGGTVANATPGEIKIGA